MTSTMMYEQEFGIGNSTFFQIPQIRFRKNRLLSDTATNHIMQNDKLQETNATLTVTAFDNPPISSNLGFEIEPDPMKSLEGKDALNILAMLKNKPKANKYDVLRNGKFTENSVSFTLDVRFKEKEQ